MAKAEAIEVEKDDMRADMEAAFDELENTADDSGNDTGDDYTEASETEETQTETPEEVREQSAGSETNEVQQEVDQQRPAASKEAKAPVDWSPVLREQWKKLPNEVREKIASRERDIAVTMEQTASARHVANDFMRAVEPYRAIMAAEGVNDPIQAVEGLMRITATLNMGSGRQKAQVISNLVKNYNVPIEDLDGFLSDNPPQGDPQAEAIRRMVEEQTAPAREYARRIEEAQRAQQGQLYGQANQTIEQFGSDPRNEYFEDVRKRMAFELEQGLEEGRAVSLKEAYDIACYAHPQIRQLLQSRRPASIASKRRAASSIVSRGTSGEASSDGMSLREELESHFPDEGRI